MAKRSRGRGRPGSGTGKVQRGLSCSPRFSIRPAKVSCHVRSRIYSRGTIVARGRASFGLWLSRQPRPNPSREGQTWAQWLVSLPPFACRKPSLRPSSRYVKATTFSARDSVTGSFWKGSTLISMSNLTRQSGMSLFLILSSMVARMRSNSSTRVTRISAKASA